MPESGGLWYTETFTDKLRFVYFVNRVIYTGRTKYQKVEILDVAYYGKTLFLDEKIQSSAFDEFIFHEAITHPALITHPNPQRVLIVGGGEGATLREVLKHNTVKDAIMVDIDEELVKLCEKYLPEWSSGSFNDERATLFFQDARKYVMERDEKFDVVISDLTEPLEEGPSLYLFTKEFYKRIFDILSEDGILVVQSGSADPTYIEFFASVKKTLEEIFPIVRPYWVYIFSFQMPWGFVLASKREEPLDLDSQEIEKRIKVRGLKNLRFYQPSFHRPPFSFPLHIEESLSKGRILTDEEPFLWKA
jgi:spermidine synthase